MNLFEAIECVYRGYSVRHVEWAPGTVLTLNAGNLVLHEESSHIIHVTPVNQLHERVWAPQWHSTAWCVVTPREAMGYSYARGVQQQADLKSVMEQLGGTAARAESLTDYVMHKARDVGTSTERLEQNLQQVQQAAEVAEFEALIRQMQEADARAKLEETPGTPYGTVLREIDQHLAHAAEDPALLLLLDKWHRH